MNLKVLFPKETMTRIQNGTLEVCAMTKDAVTKQITNHFPVLRLWNIIKNFLL